eukprot:TRINITY_DN41_c0_g1_i1.p1 TRINITY_DN41_c0_g1~~TRINITY_DN41_c0_g1_i1.p1  ORF type:complete len:180 (-),score=28.13 TRINITY_DN41_c0_g1_i1:48-536(-)
MSKNRSNKQRNLSALSKVGIGGMLALGAISLVKFGMDVFSSRPQTEMNIDGVPQNDHKFIYAHAAVEDCVYGDKKVVPVPSAPVEEVRVKEDVIEVRQENCGFGGMENDDMMSKCVVCMDKPRRCLFRPCRHVVCCEECSVLIGTSCPMCTQFIETKEVVYL